MNDPLELPLELTPISVRPPRSYLSPLANVCPTCAAPVGRDCRGPQLSHEGRAEGRIEVDG